MTGPARKPRLLISSSQKAMRVPRKKLRRLVQFVARREAMSLDQIDLAVVGRKQIARLNRKYLARRGATDVLAFDLSDDRAGGLSGQIVVCADVAVAEARRRGHGPQRELMLYVVHALLHLAGYDDTTPPAAAEMHARQERLLDGFILAS